MDRFHNGMNAVRYEGKEWVFQKDLPYIWRISDGNEPNDWKGNCREQISLKKLDINDLENVPIEELEKRLDWK